MKPHNAVLLFALLTFSFVVPTLGHHSVSREFDETKATTIQGVITKVEWTNPHVWITLDARTANGSSVTWRIEIAAPVALGRAGFEKSFIDLTKSYSMEVWPAFDGSRHANGRTLTLSDGRVFDVSDKWPEGRTVKPSSK